MMMNVNCEDVSGQGVETLLKVYIIAIIHDDDVDDDDDYVEK